MSDVAVPANVTLSSSEQWLAKLGIRPEEKAVTALLFSNMFLSGIAVGMIRVCALTLFLKHYGAEQLALIAILMALVGMPLTILIDRFTYRLTTNAHIMIILGIILSGLITFRSMLGTSDSSILIFTLPLFFELVWMLFSLQFITLLTRLLNVRQAKRLSGITRSGEFIAEAVGGFLIVILLNYLAVQDLLFVAMLATALVFVVVRYTTTRFKSNLQVTNKEMVDGEIADIRMLGMLKIPYVRLIAAAYTIYMFAYYFLDVAFYGYASDQFPNEQQLASFIAQFFAVTGFLTMFTMVFLFAPFLRKFGIIAGVITFPVVIFFGSTAISVLEFSGAGVALIFSVVVAANCARFILQAAIWKPSVAILFQVMPDRQRTTGTSLIEGVVDPVSGGLAGICLFVLINMLGWESKNFMILLSLLMLVWLVLSLYIRRHYLSSLVISIRKRKLGELSISELDNSSLDIIKAGLASPYPAEIFYCLNLLEEIEHPEITELLKNVLAHDNLDVRMDVLRRIAAMQIRPLTSHVLARIEAEPNDAVRGQAIISYASLSPENIVSVLSPYLKDSSTELRRGALIGILRHDPRNDTANDYLLNLSRSEVTEDRLFASEIMGEIGSDHFSGFLVELITDPDINVVEHAIKAAGSILDSRLINPLVLKLAEPTLLPSASIAIRNYGEAALYDLDLGLISPETQRQEKLHIIDIIREIGGVKATEVLLRHIDAEQSEIRHRIFLSLAGLHFQADPDDKYIFVNKLDEEVHSITWLLAAMGDLYGDEKYHLVHSALGHEFDMKRDSMLLLVSFLFPSIVMLDTRANIDSKVAELRIFALEILDNLLTGDVKQVVLPLLDDLTVTERLEFLAERFPQEFMTPDDRFRNIVESHFDIAFFWTRNALLYQIGKNLDVTQMDKVRGALKDKEATTRETALWALKQLNPPDIWRSLSAHSNDESPIVNSVVQQLLLDVPEPEDT